MVRIYLILLSVFISIVFSGKAFAQYQELLNPQPEEEVRKFRKLGVKIQLTTSNDPLDSMAYIASYIDTTGHKVLIQKPKEKTYLMYDAQGRLLKKLDSIYGRDSLIRLYYYADYNKFGKLSMLQTPHYRSFFRYNAASRLLEERYTDKNGEEETRIYMYDEKDRIIDEEFKNAKGEITKKHKYFYNKEGKIEKETITDLEMDGSTTFYGVTFGYNNKGYLTSKHIATVYNYPGENPDPSRKYFTRYRNRNYTYEYDKNGNQVKEIAVNAEEAKSNYTVERSYDEKGLLISENTYDSKKKSRLSLNYTYEFHKKRK